MRIKHITIRVKDLEKSIKFYELMTGFKVDRRISEGDANLAFIKSYDGEAELELLNVIGGETFSGKGMFICFECNDLEEMHKIAEENKFNPSPIQEPKDGTKYFYVYDPDGVSVQLRKF